MKNPPPLSSFHARRRAFTLLELLVVIAIVAVLAALLLPAVNKVKTAGQTTTCASNLRQLFVACNTYANDNGGKYPNAMENPTTSGGYEGQFWQYQLFPYLGISVSNTNDPNQVKQAMRQGVFWCPATDDKYGKLDTRSYAMNAFCSTNQPLSPYLLIPLFPPAFGGFYPYQASILTCGILPATQKSQVVFLADHGANPNTGWTNPALRWGTSWQGTDGNATPSFRHNGKKNVCFLDGHIQRCGPNDLEGDYMILKVTN